MDLSNLSVSDLKELQEKIKKEMKSREQKEIENARKQILAIADSVGVPLKELVNVARKSSAAVSIKYRNPQNAEQQWTGRGRQPKWVKDHVDSGKSLDALRI